jgi:hypothetical protein
LQEFKINNLFDEVAIEKSAKEALAEALVTRAAQERQQANEEERKRLLATDALHASPPAQSHKPRPPNSAKSGKTPSVRGNTSAQSASPAGKCFSSSGVQTLVGLCFCAPMAMPAWMMKNAVVAMIRAME